jgi:PIN domain nuclease of toxin-antitoxin system
MDYAIVNQGELGSPEDIVQIMVDCDGDLSDVMLSLERIGANMPHVLFLLKMVQLDRTRAKNAAFLEMACGVDATPI